MEKKKRYRHELKYPVDYPGYLAVRQRLLKVMIPDPHVSDDGIYTIRSLYFDNIYDKALREKTDGVPKREKFRIRYYNDDPSYIILEKKMKINDLCLKCSEQITPDECRRIMKNDISFMKDHPGELVRELYAKQKYQFLKPKVIVSYTREAYIYRPGNVRVTFDSAIRTSLTVNDFLTDRVRDISATQSPRDMLMEVKYDAFLPEIIRDIIQVNGTRQQAFSKYGACRSYG